MSWTHPAQKLILEQHTSDICKYCEQKLSTVKSKQFLLFPTLGYFSGKAHWLIYIFQPKEVTLSHLFSACYGGHRSNNVPGSHLGFFFDLSCLKTSLHCSPNRPMDITQKHQKYVFFFNILMLICPDNFLYLCSTTLLRVVHDRKTRCHSQVSIKTVGETDGFRPFLSTSCLIKEQAMYTVRDINLQLFDLQTH